MGLPNRNFQPRPEHDKTADSSCITGEWEGYYTQHSDKRLIKALFVQQGNQISGTMTDLQTESELSLFEAVAEAGLPPGTDERIEEQIRRLVPKAGKQPIRAKSMLPDQSQLDGTIDGSFVKFTKVYQGQHFVGYQVGDKHIGHINEEHSVEYSGRLTSDGQTIEGRWTIYQQESPKGYIDGSFVLRKA